MTLQRLSFSFCGLDGYEFFSLPQKFFFHSLGVEEVHVRFDGKSVGYSFDGSSKKLWRWVSVFEYIRG